MSTADFTTFTHDSLSDPNLSPAVLTQVAHARPDLNASIAQHPQCPPELREWINAQQGGPSIAATTTPVGGVQPATRGAEPHAHHSPITAPRSGPPAGVRSMPLAAAGFGIIGLIAMALPAISLQARTVYGAIDRTGNFFTNGAQNTGGGIVTVMIIAIVAGLIGFGVKSSGARALFGTIIMLCGIAGIIIAAVVINSASEYSSYGYGYSARIEAASGTYLLLSTSICMALAGLLTLLKRHAKLAVKFDVGL